MTKYTEIVKEILFDLAKIEVMDTDPLSINLCDGADIKVVDVKLGIGKKTISCEKLNPYKIIGDVGYDRMEIIFHIPFLMGSKNEGMWDRPYTHTVYGGDSVSKIMAVVSDKIRSIRRTEILNNIIDEKL